MTCNKFKFTVFIFRIKKISSIFTALLNASYKIIMPEYFVTFWGYASSRNVRYNKHNIYSNLCCNIYMMSMGNVF